MRIIDAHFHFCPGYGHFDELAVKAEHVNTAEHLREIYKELDFLPKTQWGYVPCLCGRKCDMACYRHLKEEL